MGYKVKWVEDNLGITRKAIRVFEDAGIMPKNGARKYESNKCRDYTEDDIDRLWAIRVLQGMGYTIKEISQMFSDAEFDFDSSIAKKIKELEKAKDKLERHLGYAKAIKLLLFVSVSGRLAFITIEIKFFCFLLSDILLYIFLKTGFE